MVVLPSNFCRMEKRGIWGIKLLSFASLKRGAGGRSSVRMLQRDRQKQAGELSLGLDNQEKKT